MLADINGNLADLRSEAMASQRFCLRWNNHQSNLLSVFDQLLHDESFVDVTLAVEGQLLKAHKMVLSACSPYFQALFTNHPDKHPIVILKDVPYGDMRSLLDFMYRGEVSVDQDRLPAFLRVAETLRIKGLTEVNEEKCDLPSITSSLLGNNQNTLSQQQQQQPPPNLHRINQIGSQQHQQQQQQQHHHHHHHHHGGSGSGGQKRYHHMSSHPLLGSALTAPKRKRGRPRKLSGSSDTGGGDGPQDLQTSDLVQGSPEMMEMKMGIDFQSETSTGNGNANNSGSNRSANSTPGPITGRKDDSMENGERDTPEPPVTPKIKKELEPTPSTSAQEFGSVTPGKTETGEKNKTRDSSVSRTSSPSTQSQTDTASRLTPTPTTTTSTTTTSSSSPSPSPSTTSTTKTNNNTTSVPSITNNSSSTTTTTTTLTTTTTTTTTTPTTTTTTTTNKNINTSTAISSNNKNTTNSPASGRAGNQVQSTVGATNTNEGAMSAPTGRQVPKRRMRRRATSQSQDPAEQLTEMSVRGLNLFRYASISEGVYQCTECAKLDIQKTFKNKYSFQRHAFLYHEGHQRKVFPCPVCSKEFSRPDKMKNHMKTVHECFMPKDCLVPFDFYNP